MRQVLWDTQLSRIISIMSPAWFQRFIQSTEMLTKMVNISTSQVGTRLFVFYLFCFFNQSNSQQNYKIFFFLNGFKKIKEINQRFKIKKEITRGYGVIHLLRCRV